MASKTIYLIRHGQTDTNLRGELQGQRDNPLNAEGRGQAGEIRKYFDERGIAFERIYSSPLIRAVETAEIATRGDVPLTKDRRLIEIDYGKYDGMSLQHLPAEVTEFFRDFVNHPAPPGMETLESVLARTRDFLADLPSAKEDSILISTHAIALKGILENLTPAAHGKYWSVYLGNCCIFRTVLKDGQYLVPAEVFAGRKIY